MDEKELEQLLREIVAERNAKSDANGWGVKFGVVRDACYRRTLLVARKGVMVAAIPVVDRMLYDTHVNVRDLMAESISAALYALNERDLLHEALAEQFKLASMLR